MGWVEDMKTALFGDGGVLLGCMCLSKNRTSDASPVHPAAPAHNSTVDDVPEVTLRELKKATRSFSDAMRIGEGRYAAVYMASLPGGLTVAAKRLGSPSPDHHKASDVAFLLQQASSASRLRHDNLIRLLGYHITADLRVLLYEFAAGGTLHDALHGPRGKPAGATSHGSPVPALSWTQRVRIALDAARGLAYLHEASVTHHDIRSTNVLLFEGYKAKIADYDLFKQLPASDVETGYCVRFTSASEGYRPPELCFTGHLTPKSDVFNFGVVLLELLTGIKPGDSRFYSVANLGATPRVDPKLRMQYPRARARKLATIAIQCLQPEPANRPSMATVAREIEFGVVQGDTAGGEGRSGAALESAASWC